MDFRKTQATSNNSRETDKSEETNNELQLVCYAEMQCIDTIYFKESEKLLKIIYRRYQSIKLYHEFE